MSVRILILLLATGAFAQESNISNFVLDTSKPYVYLKFDHIGSRQPRFQGEGNTGLWLRAVNNCRLPILFEGHNALPGESGFYLFHEVVEEELYMTILDKTIEEIEKDKKLKQQKLKSKPWGYSDDTGGRIWIQPGKDILFSVPINHVDDDWYIRVEFTFALYDSSSLSNGPVSYLTFKKWDIPKQFRDQPKGGGPGEITE
jgi:hypothetical protein